MTRMDSEIAKTFCFLRNGWFLGVVPRPRSIPVGRFGFAVDLGAGVLARRGTAAAPLRASTWAQLWLRLLRGLIPTLSGPVLGDLRLLGMRSRQGRQGNPPNLS